MKRRLIALAAAVALSTAGTATLVAGQASAAGVSSSAVASSAGSAASRPLFAGHTYLITVDDGTVYRNTYAADGTSFTSLTVAGDGAGESFTTTLQSAQTGLLQYFVSWVEPGGITVSQVINFASDTVKIFFTFEDATGAREGQLHSATISRVS